MKRIKMKRIRWKLQTHNGEFKMSSYATLLELQRKILGQVKKGTSINITITRTK